MIILIRADDMIEKDGVTVPDLKLPEQLDWSGSHTDHGVPVISWNRNGHRPTSLILCELGVIGQGTYYAATVPPRVLPLLKNNPSWLSPKSKSELNFS